MFMENQPQVRASNESTLKEDKITLLALKRQALRHTS